MKFENKIAERREKIEGRLHVEKTEEPQEIFDVSDRFLEHLRKKYPELDYPKGMTEFFRPENTGSSNVLYSAKISEEVAGIFVGRKENEFYGIYFLVDPEFQNTEVATQLIRSVQSDFDTVTLVPSPIVGNVGHKGRVTSDRSIALVRYYEKLGFSSEKSGLMRWMRKKEEV